MNDRDENVLVKGFLIAFSVLGAVFLTAATWISGLFLFLTLPFRPTPQIKKGDRFEIVHDFKTKALRHWKAPFTDGFKCVVPKGTILIALSDGTFPYMLFAAIPDNYSDFEEQHVAADIRGDEKYDGYSILLPYWQLGRTFRRLN